MAFLHLVKVVCDVFFSTNAEFEPWSVKRNLFRSIWTVYTTYARYLYFLVLLRWKKKQYRRGGMLKNNEKS